MNAEEAREFLATFLKPEAIRGTEIWFFTRQQKTSYAGCGDGTVQGWTTRPLTEEEFNICMQFLGEDQSSSHRVGLLHGQDGNPTAILIDITGRKTGRRDRTHG